MITRDEIEAIAVAVVERLRGAQAAAESTEGMLTVAETAERLGVTPGRVYQLLDDGELPGVRIGKRQLRIPASAAMRSVAGAQERRVKLNRWKKGRKEREALKARRPVAVAAQ